MGHEEMQSIEEARLSRSLEKSKGGLEKQLQELQGPGGGFG